MTSFKSIAGAWLALGAVLAPANSFAQVFQAGPSVEIEGGSGPVFAMGGEVSVTGDIGGGPVFAAGGSVVVDASVSGDLMTAGGDVSVSGQFAGVKATGGDVFFGGQTSGDAEFAGGSVEIGDGAVIDGDLKAAGGEVVLTGDILNDASLAGGEVRIDGRVAGDLEIAAEDVVIGPNAIIEGELNYKSPSEASIADGAEIRGDTIYNQVSSRELDFGDGHWSGDSAKGRAFGALFWFVASAASGALMGVLFPGWMAGAATAGRDAPIGTFIMGLGVLLLTPILAVLFMVIIIGLPLGLLLLAIYGGLLIVSSIGAGYAAGHLFFDRTNDDQAKLSWFFAGLAIILILGAAPFIGWVVSFLSAAFGMGALSLSLLRSLRVRQFAE
jgi:cytoskeletal protein CcmA (bactofilin family)